LVAPTPSTEQSYIYPSPIKGSTAGVVYQMASPGRAKIRIFNIVGDLVARSDEFKGTGLQETRLSVGGYAPGVYLYKIDIEYASGGKASLPVKRFVVAQ